MAQDDIYGNKGKYEFFKQNLDAFLTPPTRTDPRRRNAKYHCKNSVNLDYFKKLFAHFEARDTSYVRRNRLLGSFRLICYATDKDLAQCDREDINTVVTYMHQSYKTSKSKSDFIRDIKYIWKILFPEKDEKGRIDDTLTPYPVRHLSPKIDKSQEKRRGDKLTWEEYEQIVNFFADDSRLQLYLTLSVESLGRPQEILYTKIKDVELYDNYAKIWISEHGKEGTGFLRCIDSYPYLVKWLEKHPFRNNPNSFLFVNIGDRKRGQQLKPTNINVAIRTACKYLGIDKPVSAYSLKRNGVTFKRLAGYTDVEIQHTARWTSTKQLKVYDLSQHDDTFKMELVKRGLIKDDKYKELQPKVKECLFCQKKNGFTAITCENCKRPLDREKLRQLGQVKETEYGTIKNELEELKRKLLANEGAVLLLNRFLENPEAQELFKATYKAQLANGVGINRN